MYICMYIHTHTGTYIYFQENAIIMTHNDETLRHYRVQIIQGRHFLEYGYKEEKTRSMLIVFIMETN